MLAIVLYKRMKVFSLYHLATTLQVNHEKIKTLIKSGAIPSPNVVVRGKKFYTPDGFKEAISAYCQVANAYSLRDVINMGFTEKRIKTLLQQGLLPQREIKIGKREFWAIHQIKKVVAALLTAHLPLRFDDRHEQRRADGWFSKTDVATMCGVKRITIDHHITKGRIIEPKKRLVGFNGVFYSKKEVAKITKFMASIKSEKFKRGPE